VQYADPDGVEGTDERNTTVSVDSLFQAAFTVSPSTPVSETITTFTDASTGGTPTAWQWDFGDGSALATVQNPTHTYAISGVVTVALTSTFGTCCEVGTARQVTVTAEAGEKVYLPFVAKDS
jgi:PKD repeat protein